MRRQSSCFRTLFLLLGGVFLMAGCATHSTHFFPLGIYGASNAADLEKARDLGFNLVCGPARADFLDAAATRKLKVLADPGTSAGTHFDQRVAREAVAAFDRHPALWAWYLADEPDLNHVSPAEVANANRCFQLLRATRPTALVVYQGQNAFDYREGADILMIDRYPIPWLPLANFGQHVRLARLAAGSKKSLLAVIQAFDWSYFRELLPDESNFRAPTFEELRCMAYGALAQRANGILFYALRDAKWNLSEHPAIADAVRRVVTEINTRRPLFQAEHQWWLPEQRYRDPAARFNASLDNSVTTVLVRVPRTGAGVQAGDYIIAVNTTEREHTLSFRLPRSGAENVTVLNEARTLGVNQNRLEDTFPPLGVHVYGPLP